MLYKTFSAAVYGIDANIIEVEVDVSGIKTDDDHFHTVGLPDAAVRESRDRVRSALRNCGYDILPTHITVNLAPADIRKEGSGFDQPMALGILGAYGGLNKKELLDSVFVGELSLNGGVRGIRGTLLRRACRRPCGESVSASPGAMTSTRPGSSDDLDLPG
jgi:magnesium chelatase family protein